MDFRSGRIHSGLPTAAKVWRPLTFAVEAGSSRIAQGYAECEWIARRNDPWDVDVAPVVREQNETWQTLRDALSVREVLFASIPQLQVAMLKVYRQRETGDPELIIAGKREPGRQPAAREFFAHGGSTLRIPILPGGRSSSASGNPQSTAIRN